MSSAKALGALRCPEAVAGLLQWLAAEPDTMVLIWIALSLGKLGDHSATEALIALLQTAQSETLRYSVVRALGDLGDKRAIPAIRPYLVDPDRHVSKHAQQALTMLQGRSGEVEEL
jgi:HEAT repeat protein